MQRTIPSPCIEKYDEEGQKLGPIGLETQNTKEKVIVNSENSEREIEKLLELVASK